MRVVVLVHLRLARRDTGGEECCWRTMSPREKPMMIWVEIAQRKE
jgi:hypothetical protein